MKRTCVGWASGTPPCSDPWPAERHERTVEYSRLKIYIGELLGGAGDVVNRRTLKPLLRENILRDCVNAF